MKCVFACFAVLPVVVSGSWSASGIDNLLLFQHHVTTNLNADHEGGRKDEWNFCGVDVSNNLGGLGPDFEAPREMRFKKVLLLATGQEMDLVVKNKTEYIAKRASKNGEEGCYGRISTKSPGSVTMEFKLVATGTDDFVDDLEHDFTIMDLDHSKAGMRESITTSGYSGTPLTEITPTSQDGQFTFEGLEKSIAITDPKSVWNLTGPQKASSIGFRYSAGSSWEITFTTWDKNGASNGGRNFLFAGTTSLQDPTPCGEGTINNETGVCVIYQDPHIDGFDNPRNGPFLTRISSLDMPKKHTLLLGSKRGLTSWIHDEPATIDVNEYERGDFWLVKNAQLSIQGRYNESKEFPGGRSGLAAVAIGGPMLDSGIVTLEAESGAIKFFGERVNDVAEHARTTMAGTVAIKTYKEEFEEDGVSPLGVDLTLPSGVFVHVRRYNTHLDAKIILPRQLGAIDGQCGNWNGDTTDDSLDSITERMGSTEVSESELLFAQPWMPREAHMEGTSGFVGA